MQIWLRFYDPEGNLVLLPEEAAEQKLSEAEQKLSELEQKASQAEQKAQRLAEQLRAMGIDPDML